MTPETATENPVRRAIAFGQSIWYDGLLGTAAFQSLLSDDGVRGATTNPAIFEKALGSGEYDADILKLRGDGKSPEQIWMDLSVREVKRVCDVFRPLYDSTRGADGFVSIEVSPMLARDTRATVAEALELYRRVERPNVMIKIPATREGIPAIREVIAAGIHVNVTLIFSVERYREVMDAYMAGLEDRMAKGQPVTGIASVASFFVSRVDSSVDKELTGRSGGEALAGKIGIANSKAAYAEFKKMFGTERFARLKQKGAAIQRPLWASTGTKNPQYSDVLYVEALMGADTVNTVPPATLDAFRDHGNPASRLETGTEEAIAQLRALAPLGVDLLKVTQKLEEDGVKLFADSYQKIIRAIGEKEIR